MINTSICGICKEAYETAESIDITIDGESLTCCFNCSMKVKHLIQQIRNERRQINEQVMQKLQEIENILKGKS